MIEKKLSEEELGSWIVELAKQFSTKQLVLLDGPMGAGKTFLVRTLLSHFDCKETHSPTYGLVHEYSVANIKNVYHVDLYRLEDEDELESSGFWDLFALSEGLIFVEWSQRISQSQYPKHWNPLFVEIESCEENSVRLYKVSQ